MLTGRLIITDGLGPNDIDCQYTRGIVNDTIILRNNSQQGLHNVNLTLTLDSGSRKRDRIRLWRSNATQSYSFLFKPTTRKVRLDLSCDEGPINHEYDV